MVINQKLPILHMTEYQNTDRTAALADPVEYQNPNVHGRRNRGGGPGGAWPPHFSEM